MTHSQLLRILALDVPHTRTLCLGLWAAFFLGRGTDTGLSRKLHPDPFPLQTSTQLFLLCHQKKKHMKRFLGVFFQFVPNFRCSCSKKVNFTRKHPSLGSIIGEFIDPFEILITMPKFGQELSMYICLSPVNMVEFVHPK